MNYDAQQYTFSHGLATNPQLSLHQHQLHQQQQQQQIFQHQYSQAVPTSNIYQFHFAEGGNPMNPIFQQKDAHPVDMSGNMQSRMAQHNMVQQPFIKQGVPMGIDGNSVHVVSGLNGMIYSEQKNNIKIITNPDGRIIQQSEGAVRMQPALVGVDVMGTSSFIEQSIDAQQQHQSMRVTGQGNIFAYNKQHFSGWLQPQPVSTPAATQHTTVCQSALPSFSHVWSQFPHHKQINTHHQPQHINQYQQSQHLQHQIQQQQQMQAQQHFAAPSFQTLPGIQVIKMQQQQKPQQTSVPVSLQTVSHLPQKLNCFSPSQFSHMSPDCKIKEIPGTTRGMQCVERGITVSSQAVHSLSSTQLVSSCDDHQPSTAVTYTISGPPKVTVTLDSLTHGETFSPNKFPGKSESSFSTDGASSHFIKGKTVKIGNNRVPPSVLPESYLSQPQQEWQMSQHHRNNCFPKSQLHTTSIGRSFERSSSESSCFSSPPYTFTPPSSIDSMFSPVQTQFPKPVIENSPSSGRTSVLSSSSSMMSTSPPVTLYMSSWPGSQSLATTVPTVTAASSVASSTSTTSTAAVVFSCNTVAITTTSVTSTTPSPKESTDIASVQSGMNFGNISSCMSRTHRFSCSPIQRSTALVADSETRQKVKVPYSWQRKYENGAIVYLSPSGTVLQSFEQICRYLLSDSTCKCGLECPVQVEEFFNFDPEFENQPWTATSSGENLGNLCNHRREIVALAAFHSSRVEATVNSADHCLEMGKKRERKKSVSVGEGLIVAPLKRLKTSITNAVNRHAMTLGNSTVRASTVVSEKPEALNVDLPFHWASESSVDSKGKCTTHSNLSPGRLDCQRLRSDVENNDKNPGSVQMQNVSDHEDKHTGILHQQFRNNQQSYHMNSMPHTFMTLEDNHLYHEGFGRESVTGMSDHYSMGIGFHSNQHQMQYQQSQHSHQQSASPGMFFPQGHVYPNMSHVTTPHQPQGFHPGMWPDGSTNGPTVMPHSHHHTSRPYPPSLNYQHSNFAHPQPSSFPQHSTLNQQVFGNQSLVDPKKMKSKRPKSKRDKQKQLNSIVDRSSPCLKALVRTTKTAVIPSTSASFFGNPIVFVEQQTAIINNSIASCHLTCPTPSPPHSNTLKPAVTSQPLKVIAHKNMVIKPCRETEPFRNVSLEDLDKNGNSDKDEEEDQKTGTDLDSNKSFSDTTENNDSAYLSQTGSDQERSDTTDGLDSCMDTMSKSSDIYYFTSTEEQDSRRKIDFSHIGNKSLEAKTCIIVSQASKNTLASEPKPKQEVISVPSKASGTVTKVQENKKIVKLRQRTQVQKNVVIEDVELLKKVFPGSLNGNLSLLLTADNWNVPALKQVLAQHSGGDPGQLNAAAQQIWSRISGTDADFPASNLLSAAARAQLKQEKNSTSLPPGMKTPVLQNLKTESVAVSAMCSSSVSDSKAVIVPTSTCGDLVSSVITQPPQPSCQQVGKGTNLIGNVMQFQQMPSGNFAMNMLLPANGHGHAYTTDSVHTGTLNADTKLKPRQGTINPLIAQGILATVSQTGDIGSQIKLPLASVIPSSIGPNVAQCSPDTNTVLLNSFGSRMIMNAPMPPVSVSVVTNVTKSLTQVVPAISINQAVFGTHHVTQQLLSTQQNGPQIISTGVPAPGTHIINTSPQGAQLVTTTPQGTQFVNPPPPSTHLVASTPQTSQFVNALSVQGLNNQLLIANPIQQVSPSNSLSQLSPAVAAHILTQGHQQLQQISPSFLQNQLHKQNSVINNQNIFASVSLPTVAVTSGCSDVIASSISQAAILSSNIQKISQAGDSLGKVNMGSGITHIKDTTASLGNTSVYATTNQPVFVIPQHSSNPLMQMLGSAQPLNTSSGLSTDQNIQQGNLSQIFGQSATVDQVQFQNLLAAGLNPLLLQQMMNTVSLSGVQQQQQQLQLLQLQQLMLQQLQKHGQNIQGISLPLNQNTLNSNAGQTTAIGAPAIVNAIMPQQGLQLSSVMDINNIHPCLSPVTQGFQNQLSPAAAQLQNISSALTMQHVTSVNSCGSVGVVQNGNIQNLVQSTPKHLQAGLPLQPQSFSDLVSQMNQQSTVNSTTPLPTVNSATPSNEPHQNSSTQAQQLAVGSLNSPVSTINVAKPCQPSKPKSKSKSKKSESKKIVDSESERNEEDIAATVQQILAQAVQQQKELSLAAKNQPPPLPKSKSKKSQSRSKANQSSKEHDLGKLASISDDIAIPRSEDLRLTDKSALDVLPNCSGLVEPSHFTLVTAKSSHGDVRQSLTISQSNHIFPSSAATSPQSSHPYSSLVKNSPAVTSFVEHTLSETNFVNNNTKRSSISLKDHLSSIVSKDKDGNSKKPSGSALQKLVRVRGGSDTMVSHTVQPTALISSDTSFHSKTQRKSIK